MESHGHNKGYLYHQYLALVFTQKQWGGGKTAEHYEGMLGSLEYIPPT